MSRPAPFAFGRMAYPCVGVLVLLAFWQGLCVALSIHPSVLPTPMKVVAAMVEYGNTLVSGSWVSLKATLYGFALAILLGVPLALLLTTVRWVNLTFCPLAVGLQSVPKVALAPILLVWLGTGMASKLAMAWLVAFYPVVVDTAAGLQSTPKEILELARLSLTGLQDGPVPGRLALRTNGREG